MGKRSALGLGMYLNGGRHWDIGCTGTWWRPSLGKVGVLRFGMYCGMGVQWDMGVY